MANYGEDTVSDLLDYRFSLVKGSLAFPCLEVDAWTPAIEYNLLNSQATRVIVCLMPLHLPLTFRRRQFAMRNQFCL